MARRPVVQVLTKQFHAKILRDTLILDSAEFLKMNQTLALPNISRTIYTQKDIEMTDDWNMFGLHIDSDKSSGLPSVRPAVRMHMRSETVSGNDGAILLKQSALDDEEFSGFIDELIQELTSLKAQGEQYFSGPKK